ncbi:uncharacterized protein BP01DRAFT_396353 [Aspergillus saccharolyticus JOP 1030-1]|uniref:Xylanolytic transcriptional activator regulatory domain-containing protein n=1 Tax=Aspergillus saccharolyticus JOP 1030-1 TaxID=1450539 RepID=A0A318ZRL4_9EURO|nr:hypothetical protein BP01DRAFT_396353 [Aspergillus saccharolyticus JOP 1030-1]PYH49707.1 hypothetical protein BP01DRAFT_396353 [Aspergillus saccharolyticus JOP 1030-1]
MCSGGQPCSRCQQAGRGDSCQYAVRDRKLKVQESYIDEILSENSQLKEQLRALSTPNSFPSSSGQLPVPPPETYPSVQNPLRGDRAWFYPYDSYAPPVYMGEAACTAFSTGCLTSREPSTRLSLLCSKAPLSGLGLPKLPCVPSGSSQVNPRSARLRLSNSSLRDDPALTCKFFGLFALGEVYSYRSNASSSSRVPETKYYVRAMSLIPIMPERLGMVHVESLLLLSLYSYFLNRRHSGYMLIGSAMRLGLVLEVNHNIPAQHCADPIECQHRVRLWWAIYVFDRMFTSKIGFPLQIRDEDIHVGLPTDVDDHTAQEQFSDTAYLVASITLSRIIGQTVDKIYGRKHHVEPFLQREQQLLFALQDWLQSLPVHHIVSSHLQFNQTGQRVHAEHLPQPVITISEACIHAARHSHSLIIEEWVNSSLPMYGYFYAQYLFSYCIALVISGLLPSIGNPADLETLGTATEILHRMSDQGNLAAAEFSGDLRRVKQALPATSDDTHYGEEPRSHTPGQSVPSILATAVDPALKTHSIGPSQSASYTMEMAFLEPTMQDFLGTRHGKHQFCGPGFYGLLEDVTFMIIALCPSFMGNIAGA